LEKRREKRSKRRLTCELVVGEDRHSAIVRDISPGGLFLQTRAKPRPESRAQLIFPAHGRQSEIRLEVRVARQRVVPAQLQSAVAGGLGVELIDPPPDFLEWIGGGAGTRPETEKASPPDDPDLRTFRVRVAQHETPRSKLLTVRCSSPTEAGAAALERTGSGWKVAEVEEI
jgi:hypothetical protein